MSWCESNGLAGNYICDCNNHTYVRVYFEQREIARIRFHINGLVDKITMYRSGGSLTMIGVSLKHLKNHPLIHINVFKHDYIQTCALCLKSEINVCDSCRLHRLEACKVQTRAHLLLINASCLAVPKDITWYVVKRLADHTALILLKMPALAESLLQ